MYKKSVLTIVLQKLIGLAGKNLIKKTCFNFAVEKNSHSYTTVKKTEKNVLTLFFQKSLKTKKSQKRQENLAAVKKELLPFSK